MIRNEENNIEKYKTTKEKVIRYDYIIFVCSNLSIAKDNITMSNDTWKNICSRYNCQRVNSLSL